MISTQTAQEEVSSAPPPRVPWSDSWWYATVPLETLMWDAKASTKSLRSLIKSLGDAHKYLGERYSENASKGTTTSTTHLLIEMEEEIHSFIHHTFIPIPFLTISPSLPLLIPCPYRQRKS